MLSIDSELKWLALNDLQDIQEEIMQNNDRFTELHSKIRQLDTKYKIKDKEVNSTKNKDDVATRDDMEVVFEDKYTAAYEIMTFKKQPRAVKKVYMVAENVEIEVLLGGKGFNHQLIIYRCTSDATASLVKGDNLTAQVANMEEGEEEEEEEEEVVVDSDSDSSTEDLRPYDHSGDLICVHKESFRQCDFYDDNIV
ncbi:hypothetical protein BGZ74_001085 [Mortierella antarctica]|nr:hypothetical protein BGZ74_001085 [Mortierella antarctica]